MELPDKLIGNPITFSIDGREVSEVFLLKLLELSQLRKHIDPRGITEKVDRGGGFATARECHEVLSCTYKVHGSPRTREAWNGFRTALDGTALK